jgi:hypothetical protein
MNMEKRLKALASLARGERPPEVDVSARVLEIIAGDHGQVMFVSEKPWAWLAVVSSAAAVLAVLFTIVAYNVWADPLSEISQAVAWVMQ